MTDPKLRQAAMLAEAWKRSSDDAVKRCGADLADVLDFEDQMPAGFNRPVRVPADALMDAVSEMLEALEANDTAGGFVEYEWADEPGKFDVRCRYRVGSSMGQGSVRILHAP